MAHETSHLPEPQRPFAILLHYPIHIDNNTRIESYKGPASEEGSALENAEWANRTGKQRGKADRKRAMIRTIKIKRRATRTRWHGPHSRHKRDRRTSDMASFEDARTTLQREREKEKERKPPEKVTEIASSAGGSPMIDNTKRKNTNHAIRSYKASNVKGSGKSRDNVGGWAAATAVEVRDEARLTAMEEEVQKENLRENMGGRKEAMSDLGRSHGII
ncbi:hypothetical protein PILCRDRAFT_780671 [Piloderma croceum F 1598]|uniref:Uncharacterized protein n=1 Tax=Piloderma croceum (strain F 1598) TaxID=765440 RepID=A0A0C3FYL3_PILCF|nr:hypothetical protein PILCRDRAFT_780671 [Piloderma croceum F 1598]